MAKIGQMFEREKQEIESALSKPQSAGTYGRAGAGDEAAQPQPLKPDHRPAFHALLHERQSRTRTQGERSEVIRLYLPASELLFRVKTEIKQKGMQERFLGVWMHGDSAEVLKMRQIALKCVYGSINGYLIQLTKQNI